jgi:ribosomal-protein-alanine N-acetyltransferase
LGIKIETRRLIIREYREDDFAHVHEYCRDPEVSRHMLWGPNSEAQTMDFIRRAVEHAGEEQRHNFELAVESKETQRVIGGISLRIKNAAHREADIGYCYSPTVWGQGIGTEAAQAMLKFGFEKLGLHRIWATCDIDNKGSEAIMGKIGMNKEAHFRQNELLKGKWRDTFLYAILDEEWKKLAEDAEIIIGAV